MEISKMSMDMQQNLTSYTNITLIWGMVMSDRMSNSYGICHHVWKGQRSCYSISIIWLLMSQVLLWKTQQQFRIWLIHELLPNVYMTSTPVQRGRSSSYVTQVPCLKAQQFSYWHVKGGVICSLGEKERDQPAHTVVRVVAPHFVWLCVLRIITWKQTFRKLWYNNEWWTTVN
jgi:hypothetical protein